MSDWTQVALVHDVKPGSVIQVELDDELVCLANVDGEFLATSDVCSHRYVMLSEGWLEGDEIECPKHGSKFNMRTGEAVNPPATEPIAVYEVKVDGDTLLIRPKSKE